MIQILKYVFLFISIVLSNTIFSQNNIVSKSQILNNALSYETELFNNDLNKSNIEVIFNQWNSKWKEKLNNDTAEFIYSLTEFIFKDIGIISDINSVKLSDLFLIKKGNCVTISMLYLLLADMDKKTICTVNAPTHHFIRYYFDSTYINVEPTENGANYSDTNIINNKDISQKTIQDGIYMREGDINNLLDNYYANLASLLLIQGKTNEALKMYSELIKKDTLNPECYYNIGLCYYNRKEYESAISNYSKAIALDKTYYLFHFDRANAHHKFGIISNDSSKFINAIKDYSKSIELNKNFAKAYFSRGNSYFSIGKTDKACLDWKKALTMNYEPEHKYWKDYCK